MSQSTGPFDRKARKLAARTSRDAGSSGRARPINEDATIQAGEREQAAARRGVVRQAGGWPYRWWLPPIVITALVYGAGVGGHLWWALPKTLAGFGVAAAIAGLWIWRVARAKADRIWAGAAVVAAGGWLPVAVLVGPFQPAVAGSLLVALVVLAPHWWRHPWTRRKVRTDLDLRAWPDTAVKLGIPGATLARIVHTRVGRKLLLELEPPQTWRSIRHEDAESVLNTALGAVTVERQPASARRVVLHIQDRDPWAGGGIVPHPVLRVLAAAEQIQADPLGKATRALASDIHLAEDAARWGPGKGTVREPIEIGVTPDGEPAYLPTWVEGIGSVHWLVEGATGSGKSVFYRDVLGGLGRCRDVIVWGIDTGKLGKVFTPWQDTGDGTGGVVKKVARNLAEAVQMLRDAKAHIDASAAQAAAAAADGIGSDNVEPSPEQPQLVIMFDEAADVLDISHADPRTTEGKLKLEAVELTEAIAAKSRSEAVQLILATQKTDNMSLGGSAKLKSHITVGICLRMRKAEDIKHVLVGDAVAELDVSLFRHPGMLYAQVGPDTVPVPIRSYALLEPADARRVANYLASGMAHPTGTLAGFPVAARTSGLAVETSTPVGHEVVAMTQPDQIADLLATKIRLKNPPQDAPLTTGIPEPMRTEPTSKAAHKAANETVRAKIRTYSAEVDADQVSTAPPIPLTELAKAHIPTEVSEPGDDQATAAIHAALTAAGPAGMRRHDIDTVIHATNAPTGTTAGNASDDTAEDTESGGNVLNHRVQRLLAAMERRGQVVGDPGTGPAVVWRLAPNQAGELGDQEAELNGDGGSA